MSVKDYSKTIIYKIECKNSDIKYIFIGSTTCLSKIKCYHKRCILNNTNNILYTTIIENGGWDNWRVVVLENYTGCLTKTDSNLRVDQWTKSIKTGNSLEPPPTSANLPPNSANLPPNSANLPPNSANTLPDSAKNIIFDTNTANTPTNSEFFENKIICNICKSVFTRTDSLYKHKNKGRCKIENDNIIRLQELLILKDEKIKMLEETIDSNTAYLNNKINNSNNNNINNSNNVVQNNYKIELGSESFSDFLSVKQKIEILNNKHNCVNSYAYIFHFSGKYPQFMNFVIPNTRSTYAKKFSEAEEKFVVVNVNDASKELFDTRLNEVKEFNNEHNEKLSDKNRKIINEFISNMEDENGKKYKKEIEKIKIMAYNNRDKINIENCINVPDSLIDEYSTVK